VVGLGELTPFSGVAPRILMRFVIGFPLTRKVENTRKRANVLSKLSTVKTGVILIKIQGKEINIVLVSTHLPGRR